MSREAIRKTLKHLNITSSSVTYVQIIELRKILNKHLKQSGIYNGTAKLDKIKKCYAEYITMNTEQWKNREAVSFNQDGFIGIAGWADDTNVIPILSALLEWKNKIKENK